MPATTKAQAKKTRGTFTTAAEFGARAFTNEPSDQDKGKFNEYRSLPNGALLERLSVGYTPADGIGTYQLTVRRVGQLDQSLWLQAARPNLYDFNLRWDRTPHLYSSTAHSPGDEGVTTPGYNTLPFARPDSTAWKNGPYIGDIRTLWDPMKASLVLTPTDELDTKFEWLRIGKKGGMPKSISFSGSSGPQREYVSPIDETVNNFKFSQSFTSAPLSGFVKSFQGTASFEYSKFHNALQEVFVDNPALSTPVGLVYNATTKAYTCATGTVCGTNTAAVSLPPSNSASTVTLVGSVTVPLRTRITGSLNTSTQLQNDPFLPQFNNTTINATTDPNFGLLTNLRPGLEGKVKLTTFNVTANSHPLTGLSLGVRYRSHKYENETPQGHIRSMVVSDRANTLSDSLYTEWDPYTKANTDFSAAYQVVRGGSIGFSYGIEDFTREAGIARVDATKEKSPRFTADYSGISWLSLHASYLTGKRRYSVDSVLATDSVGKYRQASTEVSDMRSYMFADRDRTRTTLMATVTPVDQVNVGLTYQKGEDKYGQHGQRFGLMNDKNNSTGLDVDWTPSNRVTVGVGYFVENADLLARYRYRTGAVGSVTYDNPSYYWTTTTADKNTGVSLNVKAVLIPNRLEVTGSYSVIDAKFQMNNINDSTPAGGTAAQNLSATVENWPEVSNKLTPVVIAIQYKYSADWAFTLRYNSEVYANQNFQAQAPNFTNTTLSTGTPTTTWTGNLPGNVGATTGTNTGQYHFLGNNYNPYKAGWLSLTVSWHPSSLPLPAGRALY